MVPLTDAWNQKWSKNSEEDIIYQYLYHLQEQSTEPLEKYSEHFTAEYLQSIEKKVRIY